MAYRPKIQALNDICVRAGGAGGHNRTVRALNEWSTRLGGIGGHTRNVRALNEICERLGVAGGHFRDVDALNAIAVHFGGTGGHARDAAALGEIAARMASGAVVEAAVPVFVFGDSNTDPGYSRSSWVHRSLAALDGRFFCPPGGNLGSAGKNTLWAVRQLPFLQALTAAWGPGVVWYHHGYNYSAAAPAEAASFLEATKALGHRVVWIVPGPWTDAAGQFVPGLVASYAADPKVRIVRADLLLTNSGPNLEGTGHGNTEDGNHLNESGDRIVRDALLPAMLSLCGTSQASYYAVNGLTPVAMSGTGGTVTGPATGQVPDGWQGTRAAGDGAVAFACVSENGADAVEVTISGGTTSTLAYLRLPAASGLPLAVAAGDVVDFAFSGRQVSGQCTEFGIANRNVGCGGDLSEQIGAGVWRSGGLSFPEPAAAPHLDLVLQLRAPAGKSATVRFLQVAGWKRTVPDFAPLADRADAPALSDPVAGAACTASPGTWLAKPNAVSLAYQWALAGAPIAGATAAAYTPPVAATGGSLSCMVTAQNGAGSSVWTAIAKPVAAAGAVPPVIAGTPAIAGGGTVGAVQSVTGFTASGTPAPGLAYSWRVGGTEVGTGPTYTLVAGDVNGVLSCTVTASNPSGSVSATTAGVPVAAAPSGYQSETDTFLARIAALSGPAMNATQAAALDAFYVAAKASSWWAKVHRLYVGGLHCQAAASVDLRDQATTLTQVGSGGDVTWTPGAGWGTGGVLDRGLDMHASPAALAGQNSISLFLWCPSYASGSAAYDLRSADGTVRMYQASNGSLFGNLNQATGFGMGALGADPGFRCASRTGQATTLGYDESGAQLGTSAVVSAPPTATALYMHAAVSGVTSARTLLVAGFADGLTGPEVQGLRDALATLGAAFWLA